MNSVREVLREATAKRSSGAELTELEKIVLWRMGEDIPECTRWSNAFRDYQALMSATEMPAPAPLSGGMYCWELDSPEEYKCVAMGEGGYGILIHTRTGQRVENIHMDQLTTRSPFGRYELLSKVAPGSTIYYNVMGANDTPCWTVHQLVSSDETNIVLRNSRGGSVVIPEDRKDTLVSYVPPVWSSFFNGKIEWRLDPFAQFLYLDYGKYTGGGTLKCREDINRAVDALKRDLPGLWAAWNFLTTSSGFVFKVPGYEYAVWTSAETWAPPSCWTHAHSIPERAIPAVWAHGHTLLRTVHGPDIRTGWYISPWGLRFTNSNIKIDLGSSFVLNIPNLEVQFTLCTLRFDSAEEAQTFTDASARACVEYTRAAPDHLQLCAAAGGM